MQENDFRAVRLLLKMRNFNCFLMFTSKCHVDLCRLTETELLEKCCKTHYKT